MMRMLVRISSIFCALLFATSLHAAIDPDEFENEAQRQRYQQFIADLRCPKCQNQNLAGSDAPIAADLRKELRRLLKDGQSDQQIVDFMVSRYGEFVLYKPRFDRHTAMLWLAPAFLLGAGAVVVGMIVWRHRRSGVRTHDAAATLSADEQAQLAALFNNSSDDTAAAKQQGRKDA